MSTLILTFIISFIIGYAVRYYGAREDIKEAKSLEYLKIKYNVEK